MIQNEVHTKEDRNSRDALIKRLRTYADAYAKQPLGREIEGTGKLLNDVEAYIQNTKDTDLNYRDNDNVYMPDVTQQVLETIDDMANLTKVLIEYLGTQPSKLSNDDGRDYLLEMLQNKIAVMSVQVFISLIKLKTKFNIDKQVGKHLSCVAEMQEFIKSFHKK